MSDAQILHFFGGKGGAGKTTLSLAFAMNMADQSPSEKILLVGMDSLHSLSELLKKKLSQKPTRVFAGKGTGGLFIAEGLPDANPFLDKMKAALGGAGANGLLLSDRELQTLFSESLRGAEELGSLFQLLEWTEKQMFDRFIFDLGAIGQVLRSIDAIGSLKKVVQLARGEKPSKGKKEQPSDAPKSALEEVSEGLERLGALLRDPQRSAFHLVALAEPAPEVQTRAYFHQLKERGIPVTELVVNLVEDHGGCPACQGRRGLQAPHVRKFQALDKSLPVHLLGRRESSLRGAEALRKLSKELASAKETKSLEFSVAEGPPPLVRAPSMPPIAAPALPPTRLIFFVGQGGVGKTSCAAAAAVTLTEKEGPVLLVSVDPSHSLSDVLQSRLTDTESQVKGTKGLYARELDSRVWMNALKRRIREHSDGMFQAHSGSGPDREVLRNLLEFAPSGIEELASISVLADVLFQERFKRIVVDPSPAKSGLHLIESAELAKGWLSAIWELLVKYRSSGTGLADEIATLLKKVKRFEEALATPAESRFVVVTRGEEMAVPRTEKLVEVLKAKKLNVERVLVNRVLPKSSCEKCENRRKLELSFAKNFEKRLGLPITLAPALGRHPAGLRELKAFRTSWYALSTPAKVKAA